MLSPQVLNKYHNIIKYWNSIRFDVINFMFSHLNLVWDSKSKRFKSLKCFSDTKSLRNILFYNNHFRFTPLISIFLHCVKTELPEYIKIAKFYSLIIENSRSSHHEYYHLVNKFTQIYFIFFLLRRSDCGSFKSYGRLEMLTIIIYINNSRLVPQQF